VGNISWEEPLDEWPWQLQCVPRYVSLVARHSAHIMVVHVLDAFRFHNSLVWKNWCERPSGGVDIAFCDIFCFALFFLLGEYRFFVAAPKLHGG
jgi:hypothetical protein